MTRDTDVVIVGAPRSGTNMLRDVITRLPGYSTWPCDEINLTWRHGNRALPSDELESHHARPEVQAYVRRQFDRVRDGNGAVVEKTCANSLRVEFVHRVVPDARFIFITRDGYDAAASAMQRWNAPLEIGYTVAKARWMPPSDILFYGRRFAANIISKRRAARAGATTETVGWWGPKPHEWQRLSESRPLDEVCMVQWQRCVDIAERGLATLPAGQVHRVSYEEFVREPHAGLRGILSFLDNPNAFDTDAVADVSSRSIGKGRQSLTPDARARLATVSAPTMTRLGYAL